MPAVNAKDKVKNLGLAEPVIWFNGNDLNQPHPGIVVATDGQGVLDITLIPVNGGTVAPRLRSVRHFQDPYLAEHPESTRRVGSWGTPAECEQRRIEEQERIEKLAKARLASSENRTISAAKQLKAEGVSLEEIARRLDVSKEKAIEILA